MTARSKKVFDKLNALYGGGNVMHHKITMSLGNRRIYVPTFVVYREGKKLLAVSIPYPTNGKHHELYKEASQCASLRFFDFEIVSPT